jgi:hypothetical protein
MQHYCRWTDQQLVGNTPIIGAISTNSWRLSKFWQYLQTLYRTTILEFNRFLTDFGYELSNNKSEQLLPSNIIGSWRFFRARVDQLHMSNNASHIFFSVIQISIFSNFKCIFFSAHCTIHFQTQLVFIYFFDNFWKINAKNWKSICAFLKLWDTKEFHRTPMSRAVLKSLVLRKSRKPSANKDEEWFFLIITKTTTISNIVSTYFDNLHRKFTCGNFVFNLKWYYKTTENFKF